MADPKRPQVPDGDLIDAIWRQATTAAMSDGDWLDTAPAEDDDADAADDEDEDEDDEDDEDEDDEDDDEDDDDESDDAT
jgi:hypothetical protein